MGVEISGESTQGPAFDRREPSLRSGGPITTRGFQGVIWSRSDQWLDEFAGYAAAIRDSLPDAVLVVDHFHALRLASEAVNDVRRRVQQATTGLVVARVTRSTVSAACC